MTVQAIIDLIKTDGNSWLIIIVIIMSLIEITPIKLNPWGFTLKWLGHQFNKDLDDRITSLETKLDDHITESEARDLRSRRQTILDFANSIMNGRKHTKEEFDFIISEADKYEKYCLDNDVPNGVAKSAIKEIRRVYEKCIRDHSFLKEGGTE